MPDGGKAAVLWTGGKDSCLALHEVQLSGGQIDRLITFVPPEARFRAHPLEVLRQQAASWGLAHTEIKIMPPFKIGYENAIDKIRKQFDIDTLITGDIAEIDNQPNWIRERSRKSRMKILTPLWGRDRQELLEQLIRYQFKAVFSCVKRPWFGEEWLGREIDARCVEDLRALGHKSGLDLCGERGEYHTLVLDGPSFRQPVSLRNYRKLSSDGIMYLGLCA